MTVIISARVYTNPKLIEAGEALAKELPGFPALHALGYDNAVNEVAIQFDHIIDHIKRQYSPAAARLGLRVWPKREYNLHQLARGAGEWFEANGQELNLPEMATVVGYAKRAYCGNMPAWRFQSYPFRGGWERRAFQRVWWKLIPLEERGEYTPPIPDGWELDERFLSDNDFVYVIVAKDPNTILPDGWEEVDFSEGEVY